MRRLAGLARRAGRRLLTAATHRPARRGPKPVALTVVAETAALAPGVFRVANVWHAPAFGAVLDDRGRVFSGSVREVLALTPTLAALPGARRQGEKTLFTPPTDAPFFERATVFVNWAALHNYSHFLIEALPALRAVLDADGLERFPAVAPPLLPWQRVLLRLMLGDQAAMPIEIDAPVARLGEALLAAPAERFIDAPGPSLRTVRDSLLANAALTESPDTPRRLYVSRLGATRRTLLNEADLEAAMAARGYAIVRPDSLSVRDQIALFHGAEIIVAQSGAALANVLFCRTGARIVEIQSNGREPVWARDVARVIGADWRAFVEASPPTEIEMLLAGDLRPDAAFSWRLDLEAFLAFLDRAS